MPKLSYEMMISYTDASGTYAYPVNLKPFCQASSVAAGLTALRNDINYNGNWFGYRFFFSSLTTSDNEINEFVLNCPFKSNAVEMFPATLRPLNNVGPWMAGFVHAGRVSANTRIYMSENLWQALQPAHATFTAVTRTHDSKAFRYCKQHYCKVNAFNLDATTVDITVKPEEAFVNLQIDHNAKTVSWNMLRKIGIIFGQDLDEFPVPQVATMSFASFFEGFDDKQFWHSLFRLSVPSFEYVYPPLSGSHDEWHGLLEDQLKLKLEGEVTSYEPLREQVRYYALHKINALQLEILLSPRDQLATKSNFVTGYTQVTLHLRRNYMDLRGESGFHGEQAF